MLAFPFAEGFRERPYWWDTTPGPGGGPGGGGESGERTALPSRADVVVVGSGYTGLNAAIQTAEAGRRTLVLDAEEAGWGCSSRNGGQISPGLKLSYGELAARYGGRRAGDIMRDCIAAPDWLEQFIGEREIDCDYGRVGRFQGAWTPEDYETMARKAAAPTAAGDVTIEAHAVPRREQRAQVGTDLYHGGLVFPNCASLDPGRYHAGLLAVARRAGVEVISNCRVTGLRRDGDGLDVATENGKVTARSVIIATSGYTEKPSGWLGRRIVPIASHIIATEPMESAMMERLLPGNRVVTDSRGIIFYYRASPDRRRILFGGRVAALGLADGARAAELLRRELVRVFPETSTVRLSHVWKGYVGFSFDYLPHAGERDGVYYAMGYCGSGVAMSGYLGMRIGRRAAGLSESTTAFDGIPLPWRPYYWGGVAWFVPMAVWYLQWRDWWRRRRSELRKGPAGGRT